MIIEQQEYKGYGITIRHDDSAENPREEFDHVGKMVCFHNRHDLGDKHDFADAEDLTYFLGLMSPGATPRKPDLKAVPDAPFTPIETLGHYNLFNSTEYRNHKFGKGFMAQVAEATTPELRKAVRQRVLSALYEGNRQAWQYAVERKAEYGYARFSGVYLPLYLLDHSGLSMRTGSFNDPWDSGQVGMIYTDKETILKEWGKPGQKVLTPRLKALALACLEAEVEEYGQYLRGEVYGYEVKSRPADLVEDDSDGEIDSSSYWSSEIKDAHKYWDDVDSCWGMCGFGYCLSEAKEVVDLYVKEKEKELVASV
jgi:hypothetical protein